MNLNFHGAKPAKEDLLKGKEKRLLGRKTAASYNTFSFVVNKYEGFFGFRLMMNHKSLEILLTFKEAKSTILVQFRYTIARVSV